MPHSETLTQTLLWISALGNWKFVVALAPLVVAVCWIKRKRGPILPFLATLAGTEITVELLKLIVHRARPIGAEFLETSYSFPSGHSAIAVALYGSLAFLLWKRAKTRILRGFLVAFAILLILLIGFSRVYLGVHFPTDVLGGYGVGLIWLWTGTHYFKHFDFKWAKIIH